MEVLGFGGGNVDKSLRVAINQGKPRALDLNHHTVPAPKGVADVGHRELDLGDFARLKRLRFFEAITEPSAEHVTTYKLLVASHAHVSGVRTGVRRVRWMNIDHFDHPIRIGATGRDVQCGS